MCGYKSGVIMEDRFERLEAKVDKASDLLARIDERAASMLLKFSEFENSVETRLTALEKRVQTLERWRWSVLGAAAAGGGMFGKIMLGL